MDDFAIAPIRNGTVIDHITAGQALNVLKILNVNENTINSTISVGMHVTSQKNNGFKDIIKIEDRELDKNALDKIALISPNARISIIRDFVVAEKHNVHIEDHIYGIAKCSNPHCITNMGEPIQTEFVVLSRDPVSLRCAYCDRTLVNISDNLL
ncbi:MAG: aspartate carbamoyltransferase regulatory subunit [Candidatus Methanomethylophilaceae archaeon]|nr:aspartate carbamoyltransferase regulatory subunit [Candidatus Methanomethylophilaceae archaeon]